MEHLKEMNFQQLFDGLLKDAEVERLLHHTEQCDDCLDRMDLWFEQNSLLFLLLNLPTVPEDFQPTVIQRVNRQEATTSVLQFSMDGLVRVFLFLVNTLFSLGEKSSPTSIDPVINN